MATQMTKSQMAEILLQQKDHIRILMERIEMYNGVFEERTELKKELAQVKEERDNALAEVLTDDALERLQNEAFKAGRTNGYEDAEAEFEPYKKQRELDELREELVCLKEGKFEESEVYWGANDGYLTAYKIPNEIACLNTTDGDNAVLEAFQNGYFGE